MRRPTVLLFDIDGTLVSTAGAGRRAMTAAFVDTVGRDACDFSFDGMTDRAIAREGLRRASHASDETAIDDLLARYIAHLERVVVDASRFRVFAGIREALDDAARLDGFAIGLGTGNIRRGAELKLTPVGLYHRFAFGGFGCDHEDRAELVRTGAMRGAAILGAPLADCRVVVIGDTPRDVAAARAMGAQCLAVATGGYTIDQLRDCGATFAFADLAATGATTALLSG